MRGSRSTADVLAVSVHGPAGALDLVVPPDATAAEVATEYAVQARLAVPPRLHRRLGAPLEESRTLADAGVGRGEVLLAVDASAPPPAVRSVPAPTGSTGPTGPTGERATGGRVALTCAVAAGAALLSGWVAAGVGDPVREAAALVLAGVAVLGLVPLGRHAPARALTAPAFAAAAVVAQLWGAAPEDGPPAVGAAALAAAVTAGVARALDRRAEEGLRVWILAGVAVFAVTAATTLAGLAPQVAWAVLLLAAALMARFVPALAVDVPDQLLLDLERLAVTAWSARERPAGGRSRTVVPVPAVAEVAARGTRLVTAACAAVLAVTALAAPLLLVTADLELDRIGARVLAGTSGAALLLAARSYRHPVARVLLRVAGLVAWVALLAVLLGEAGGGALTTLALAAVATGALLVVAAVATGRGWRSAWWSRRAEVAESLAGACAVASLLVATGLFRHLWELTS